MRSLLLLLLAAGSALAQPFSIGVKVGVPLTDFVDTTRAGNFSYFTRTNRYIIGGQAELRLPVGLGVEFDALYRHYNFSGSGPGSSVQTTVSSWEFPLLAKYRFPVLVARPFISGGVAWDTLRGVKRAFTGSNPGIEEETTTTGFVVGAGIDIKVVIRLQPEVRYTRWGARHFFDPNGLSSNRNQAEFLLGITF